MAKSKKAEEIKTEMPESVSFESDSTLIVSKSTDEIISETTTVAKVIVVQAVPLLSEVDFLKRIYAIQNDGCFGTHLNKEILDRIEQLKK